MPQDIKSELLELEKRFWKAIQESDFTTALSLTDDPCIVAGPQGVAMIDREQFGKMMTEATHRLREFEIDEQGAQVKELAQSMAVLAYTVREKLTVDGETVELKAAESSVWIKRGDRWVCPMHTESLLGDSFGRDRKATETKAA